MNFVKLEPPPIVAAPNRVMFWNPPFAPEYVNSRNLARQVRADFMRLSKLSYLTLWAVHFEQVRKLYKDTLGLPVAEENENFIMFDTKGSRLAFHRLTKAPPLSRSTVEVHLEVHDVDEVYSSLKSRGVKFDDPPANRPWGTRSAGFKDPEGYVVEIVGPLKAGEPATGD